jgi:hypothetical protein
VVERVVGQRRSDAVVATLRFIAPGVVGGQVGRVRTGITGAGVSQQVDTAELVRIAITVEILEWLVVARDWPLFILLYRKIWQTDIFVHFHFIARSNEKECLSYL